jgi:hypothetical protein
VLEEIGGHGGEFLVAYLMNDQDALAKFSVQHQLIAEVLGDSLLDLMEVLSESIADPETRGELAGAAALRPLRRLEKSARGSQSWPTWRTVPGTRSNRCASEGSCIGSRNIWKNLVRYSNSVSWRALRS